MTKFNFSVFFVEHPAPKTNNKIIKIKEKKIQLKVFLIDNVENYGIIKL